MRKTDTTEHICKLCGSTQTVGGIRTHFQTKHPDYNTERYVQEFGEFRPKKLKDIENSMSGSVICGECGEKLPSHQRLMYHIKKHGLTFEQYHIKYKFGGNHPLCKCGCGSPVQILKSGVIDKDGNRVWAREFLAGHNTCMQVGVQTRSEESKMKMRQSAINRMEREGRRFSPQISSAQKELYEYISELSDGFIQGNTSLLHGREVDLINHDLKLGIEYNGLYFHSDKYRNRSYHVSKMKEMEKLGYRLIYIWEDWWVRKKDIVKSMLSTILRKNTARIFARNCQVKEISDEQAKIFFHHNHIQGPSISKIRLGLFYDEELVSVMTFGKLRRTLGTKSKEGHWELLRFASKLNTSVVGGGSKLLNYFIKSYNPYKIISYANRDWSVGNLYEKMGFSFIGMTDPGYFYAKGKRRFSRSQFTKDKLVKSGGDKTKSESLIMSEMGFMKIWDTGNLKYEWNRE
jgi:hypothetical protein